MQKYSKIYFFCICLISVGLFLFLGIDVVQASEITCCVCTEDGDPASFVCTRRDAICSTICSATDENWTGTEGERASTVTCCVCADNSQRCASGDRICGHAPGVEGEDPVVCEGLSRANIRAEYIDSGAGVRIIGSLGLEDRILPVEAGGDGEAGARAGAEVGTGAGIGADTAGTSAGAGGTTKTKDLEIHLSSALGGVVRSLPEFIVRIYDYLIAIAGGIATVMIMIGGFIYLTAMGNPTQIDKAKEIIGNAVIGLFLVVGAYLVLNTINPAMLNLKMPTIESIEGKPMELTNSPNSRGLYCSEESSHVVTSGDPNTARGLCNDRCGGSDKVAVFEVSSDPRTGEGRTDVTPYCCGCVGGCPEEQRAVPDEEENPTSWCETQCTRTHLFSNVSGTDPVCCECTEERVEDSDPGNERGCLLETIRGQCGSHEGTNGDCNSVEPSGCEWEPNTCDEDSECTGPEGVAGEGHCWDGKCYQEKLRDGEACNSGGLRGVDDACTSGDCDFRVRQPSRCITRPCEGCLEIGLLCDTNEECRSGRCDPLGDSSIKRCLMRL